MYHLWVYKFEEKKSWRIVAPNGTLMLKIEAEITKKSFCISQLDRLVLDGSDKKDISRSPELNNKYFLTLISWFHSVPPFGVRFIAGFTLSLLGLQVSTISGWNYWKLPHRKWCTRQAALLTAQTSRCRLQDSLLKSWEAVALWHNFLMGLIIYAPKYILRLISCDC